MSSRQFLRLEYVTSAEGSDGWHDVLGAAAFDGATPDMRTLRGGGAEFPLAHVRTPVLGDAGGALEVWRVSGPIQAASNGRVRYSRGGASRQRPP